MSLITSLYEEPVCLNIKVGCLSLAQGVVVNLDLSEPCLTELIRCFCFLLNMQVNVWISQQTTIYDKSTDLKWCTVIGMDIIIYSNVATWRCRAIVPGTEILIVQKTVNPLKIHHRQLYQSHESQNLNIHTENEPSKTEWHTESRIKA